MLRKLASVGLVLWFATGTVLGGALLVSHLVALPAPSVGDPVLRAALAAAFPDPAAPARATPRWRAAHFLYRTCPCSRRTIAHLLDRRALPGIDELVVAVDDDGRPGAADEALRAAGFAVLVVTPAALRERFGVEAAPVFVVARPDGALAYVGGYNRHKQGPKLEDVAILHELAGHAAVAPLPVFGCATSARLADALDPFGLRSTP